MSTISLAFYKGSPKGDFLHSVTHYVTRLWTWSKWSHAEIVINGVCYSSSSRDGGVRTKLIDLNTGKWDVVNISLPEKVIQEVLEWFAMHDGENYDWCNILRYFIPFIKQSENKWVCFESIGESLGMAGSHKLTANDLYDWAIKRKI